MRKYIVCGAFMSMCFFAKGQITGVTKDFNDNLIPDMGSGPSYTLSATTQELTVNAAVAAGAYSIFEYDSPQLNLTTYPFLSVDIKSSTSFSLRIDLVDSLGKTTNTTGIVLSIRGDNNYHTYQYNFTGKFSQSYPTSSTVNAAKIVKALFYVNPNNASATNFSFTLDNIQIGSDANMSSTVSDIRINQIGFYTTGPKKAAVINQASATAFYLVSSNKQDTLFTGTLGASSIWNATNEAVRIADFTTFTTLGDYYMLVPGKGYSSLFSINTQVHHEVSKGSLKGFYFQRASTNISSTYGGPWARTEGHPDNNVLVHNSAASPLRPAGTSLSCSRGWYDAGDYNKYVVNSGISTYTLMAMYEHFHTYFDTLNLNIPESSNGIPDVLDEALWNIRWLLTMQDPYDGGVYHKLTNSTFGPTVMPNQATSARYVIVKSTAAALDFSAVTAQAARIFSKFGTGLPGLSDSCINASVRAWNWARRNPNKFYNKTVQTSLTSPVITTGLYDDDGPFNDEFAWAAAELYTTTKIDSFYTAGSFYQGASIPGWQNVFTLGCYTLSHHRKNLTSTADTTNAKSKVINLAKSKRDNVSTSPYGITLTTANIFWGSNGSISNEVMALLQAFYITKDSTYLKAAIADLDYVLGRNGVNYCFLTGYGSNSSYNIHHSVSASDGVSDPVPGLLAGGPNTDQLTDCGATSYPSSTLKGSCYLDQYCSYSTNEIAINWNAAFAYASNVIEAIESGASYSVINYSPVLPTDISILLEINNSFTAGKIEMNVFPNPAKDKINIEFNNNSNGSLELSMTDAMGHEVWGKNITESGDVKKVIELNNISKGIYYLSVKTDYTVSVKKIVIE